MGGGEYLLFALNSIILAIKSYLAATHYVVMEH